LAAPGNSSPIIVAPSRQQREIALRAEFRLLVDAIEIGDLVTGREAYGRLLKAFVESPAMQTEAKTGADVPGPDAPGLDSLGRIGIALADGDLAAASDTLDTLEARALEVLRRAEPDRRSPAIFQRPVPDLRPGLAGGACRQSRICRI
jgi:hypothetical protein